ncbi:MAG: hypothetical protein AMJ84_00190 [Acidithiobacillales bacterium SM23_46]|nr:MAG: hypothetical protein AMJ84_00190 [Acidithiobacillales bacterium SM23_46]KPL29025.1 MAG: hypothetical protein AMJ72_00260 [Acidithiobacillales bacterium SM1_46]
MARLPTVEDYGARPSLRSNRIDLPDKSGVELADALNRSIATFVNMAAEKKQKNDRLQYALAKNALIDAELEEREALKDDPDTETHDRRYREATARRREEVFGRYAMDPSDQELLTAESEVIFERGAVSVNDRAREVRNEKRLVELDGNLRRNAERIRLADPNTANDLMFTTLDQVDAAVEQTGLDPLEAEKMKQGFVQEVAQDRLTVMDPEVRVKELERSLMTRRTDGPITQEDIREGKGSGSIADFLPADTVKKMLDATKEELKTENVKGDVYDIIDTVTRMYGETDAASLSLRKRKAREMLDRNDPDYAQKRDFLEMELTQRNNEDKAVDEMARDEIVTTLSQAIEGGASYGQLDSGLLSLLDVPTKNQLRVYAERWQDNDGFAESTNEDMYYAWTRMPQGQRAKLNINTPEWKTQFTREDWNRLATEQKVIQDAQATGKDPNIYRGDPDDEVLRGLLVGPSGMFKRVPPPGTAEYERYLRIDTEVNKRLVDESLRKYNQTGSGYLSPQEVREITAQTVAERVFVREIGTDPERVAAGLTEDEKKKAYIPIEKAQAQIVDTDGQGRPLSFADYARNLAESAGKEIDDKDIEEAYYYYVTGDTAAAKSRILGIGDY